jgi:hypothetical protein
LIARSLIASLYLAFGMVTGLAVRTLPDHPSALRRAGFTLLERRSRLGGLLIAELWSTATPKLGGQLSDPSCRLVTDCYKRVNIIASGAKWK